ncbi:putative TetR family transcriptional regulator [Gordonia effusa NBRC 100432]|uniref:Putative TetR family transcriptional regulator n=1 Tax=Gordonia effusa NBRC 100432 TaxID=1077974 RepID=H0QWQ4_9ACTN|nr:TetR family transcriptional regulator [Gordonia effusa]GAB17255.1 putative TetR family transcriptional regulator [Gordonia effusa NBRC 100432]
MPPNASATKQRLLGAAHVEFAQYGLAGARVDRIAERAHSNKRLIYVHFGNKDALFDLVVARALATMAERVPFTETDLPGYAANLYDYLEANPDVLRLSNWAVLERSHAAEAEVDAYRPKIEAISRAQHQGLVEPAIRAEVLLAQILALATAWANSSQSLRTLAIDRGMRDVRTIPAALAIATRKLIAPS